MTDAFQETQGIDFSTLTPAERYRQMISHIIPRPIAWVSTLNLQGQGNLAPFSFFNGVASDPACLMISIVPKRDGTLKDTLRNILDTGVFVVNGCEETHVHEVNETSAELDYGQNELERVGLSAAPTRLIRGFRVLEAPWAMECRLRQVVDIGLRGTAGSAALVLGDILYLYQAKKDWKPLSRLGGAFYGRTALGPELLRPKSRK